MQVCFIGDKKLIYAALIIKAAFLSVFMRNRAGKNYFFAPENTSG
jgi:hypothetical protein